MFHISRRKAIATMAAVPAAAALAQIAPAAPAQAQAKQASAEQAPGVYRVRVGDLIVTRINDGQFARPKPTEGFVRNASPDEVTAALREAYLPTDALTIPFTYMAVQGGGKTALFDVGNGANNLEAAGIDAAAVDTVVISHFHGDHISGLADANGKAKFAKAEILVPEAEWAFWMDDGAMSRAPEAMKGAFQNVRSRFGAYPQERIRRYAPGSEVVPGVQAMAVPGHTPGHTTFAVASGNQQLMILSDTTNHPALFLRNPGWHVVFDMDPVQAEESRRKLFDRVAADRMLVAGYHFPFPGVGYVSQQGRGYEFHPAQWSSSL